MLRAIALLKYIPAAFCSLLLIAWISSFFVLSLVTFPEGEGGGAIYVENGSLNALYLSPELLFLNQTPPRKPTWDFTTQSPSKEHQWTKLLGVFYWHHVDGPSFWNPTYSQLLIPLPMLLLLALPFAIVPLTRFRLPLWSWFAWTALLAGALTFYLNTSRPPI